MSKRIMQIALVAMVLAVGFMFPQTSQAGGQHGQGFYDNHGHFYNGHYHHNRYAKNVRRYKKPILPRVHIYVPQVVWVAPVQRPHAHIQPVPRRRPGHWHHR